MKKSVETLHVAWTLQVREVGATLDVAPRVADE
jgi:hypothetical protein